jgi:hypothetical protein
MTALVWTAVTDLRRVLFIDKPTASHAGGSPAQVQHDVTFTQRAVCGQPHRLFLVGPADESWCVAEYVADTQVRAVLRLSEVSAKLGDQEHRVAWRASLGTLVGRDWMAGVVDLLAMIVSKRRSSSWHLIRMPFLGCVLVVASCSTHIASETAPALLVRSASIRTGGCRSDLRRQRGCHQCGRPQRQIRHQGRRPTKALI